MATLVEELTANFSRGTVDDISAIAYPSNAVAEIINGRVEPDGTVSRRPGWARTHPSALGGGEPCYGATEFITAAGVRQLVAFFGDAADYSINGGAAWTSIAGSGLREDYYSFATMRVGATMYLYAANGDSTVKRWDGTNWDTNPNAPSGVKYLAVFNGRLWYAGHSGVLVQGTEIGNPAVLSSPNGLTVQILTHSGDVPTGLYQIGPHLLVFTLQSTSYIDGFGEATLIVASGATGFSRSVGCIAFRSIVGVGENAACWLSQRGVEYYSANTGIQLVSRGLQTFFQTINRDLIASSPGVPVAAYDDARQEYHLALPVSTGNNRTMIVNLLQRGQNWLGALSVDEQQGAESGSLLLFSEAGDADGYFAVDAGGVALRADPDGYMRLVLPGEGVFPTIEDASGYLSTALTDLVAASLFVYARTLYSGGYDGFIRQETGDLDDVLSVGTGGIDITLSLVSRAFLIRRVRQKKRVRVAHVATINDDEVDVTVGVRAGGVTISESVVTIPSTAFDQPKRKRVLLKADGDAPQVALTSTDAVRVALVGVSAEYLREPA